VRPWTHAEEEALRLLSPLGGPALALAFDRTPGSIRHKAAHLHVSLRRRSFGTHLGQCSPAVLRKVTEFSQASLCPGCAKRPIGVKQTGLCGPCHLEGLRTVHEVEIATADAQRGLWAARSKLKRRRRTLAELDTSLNGSATGSERVTPEAL
jgi:hypothetical protein